MSKKVFKFKHTPSLEARCDAEPLHLRNVTEIALWLSVPALAWLKAVWEMTHAALASKKQAEIMGLRKQRGGPG